MLYFEWEFIHRMVNKYGFFGPMLDLGGMLDTSFVDYHGDSGKKGLLRPAAGRLWDAIDPGCTVTHQAESYALDHSSEYGTIVSTSTLEHVETPLEFMQAAHRMLKPGGLLVLSTVFMWPVHGDPDRDRWRFTEHGLLLLTRKAELNVLESGYKTYKDLPDRVVVYVVASNGNLAERTRIRIGQVSVPEVVECKS